MNSVCNVDQRKKEKKEKMEPPNPNNQTTVLQQPNENSSFTTPYDYVPEQAVEEEHTTAQDANFNLPSRTYYHQRPIQSIGYQPTVVQWMPNWSSTSQNLTLASTEIPAPHQIEISYENGLFLYEFANLTSFGCSPSHLQDTFSHTGHMVYQKFTLPSSFFIGFHSCILISCSLFFIMVLVLPFLSAIWWRWGFLLGAMVAIVASVGYCLLTIGLFMWSFIVLNACRQRTQRSVQSYLDAQVSSYYKSLGINLAFFYAIQEIYTSRGMMHLYKPKILVSIDPIATTTGSFS